MTNSEERTGRVTTDNANFFTTDPVIIKAMNEQDENDIPTEDLLRQWESGEHVQIDKNDNIIVTELEPPVEDPRPWRQKHVPPLRYLAIGMTRTVPNPIGRNEPCRCGSGLKYKKCCLQKEWEEMA